MEKEIDKNSKENKGKVTKKVCKTIDNKMIKFYTTMQQRWKKYIDKISGQGAKPSSIYLIYFTILCVGGCKYV